MIPLVVTTSVWIVWVLIGIVGGYMCGRLLDDGYSVWLNLLVGIVGSVGGGWAFTRFFGGTETDVYLSLISSALVCAILLWMLYMLSRTRRGGDSLSDDDEGGI